MADYDVPASRIEVITTGVDASGEFDPVRVEPLPHVDRSRPAILWPGRLVEQKDPMLTLDVVAGLRARGHDFLVHLVGDGHLEAELRERARALGVEDRLRWHPPSQAMARWYASADALLMTSVFEGVPYVVYEAFAMGRPVVVPALPGNRELVDAESGWLIDPRDDVPAYVDALEAVVLDPAGARRRGEHARRRMLDEHSLEGMVRAHEALYERLLARRRRTAKVHDPAAAAPAPDAPAAAPLRLPRERLPERTVAVVVPCFQHGRFLPECLDSIRRQTLPAAQVVVVDDASEDAETRDVLELVEDEGWATVLRLERNSGPSVARNRALARVSASYVLPLDADDTLFDDALEVMVDQLEHAPADVGFVYPNPQHFGNRHDYVEVPEYNLHLLLSENYCPATSLFDRRVFDAGVRYGEDLVLGHEDWDLVLQLADRGVWGEPAHGPTFRYRKRGFSRVDAVTHAALRRDAEIHRRHPRLYEQADRIKARWAPALSVVLLGDGDAAALAGLARQTCIDLELVAGEEVVAPDALVVRRFAAGDPAAALAAARGRWVLVTEPAGLAAFADPAAVEKLLRAMLDEGTLPGIALVAADAPGTPGLRLLDREEAAARAPVAVLWGRDPSRRRRRPFTVGTYATVVEDIVVTLDGEGPLQWRTLAGVPA
jgi:GT2 family glycosyltransferase